MRRGPVFFAALVLLAGWLAASGLRADPEARVYTRAIEDNGTWLQFSRQLGSDRFSKFIIDVKTGDIYFIDVNLFEMHADFVMDVLLEKPWTPENIREYNKNYERDKPQFILGYLTHHLKVGAWTFSFWEGDEIAPKDVLRVAETLEDAFYKKGLKFRPDSPRQEKVAAKVARRGLGTITNDAIYKGADFQAFNKGTAVGTLRVVPKGTPFEELVFDRSDIVLLQDAYPDIPPVSGIITSRFLIPLSHVNLRARAWDIPSASFKRALPSHGSLDGQVVYYEVTDTGHVLRPATDAEKKAFENRVVEERSVELPPADLDTANLAMLHTIRARDVRAYGAKTANLGEIASAGLPGVDVPPGFGLPFYYYQRHMEAHGLDDKVSALLADPRWKDVAWRKQALEELRAAIKAAPIDPQLLNALYKRVRVKLGGKGVFVRSSTNAEDLPGFNGAGLYDTVPNVRGKDDLGEAVKTVWASLWNFAAVQERELYGIDHRQVHAAVMIQVGVDATAAGVLVTANLYNPRDDDSFTINAKWGLGIRVVEGDEIPEQIIFDTSNDGTKIISRSDDPVMLVFDANGGIREVPSDHDGVILTEDRAKQLSETVLKFRSLFPPDRPLDVEWLFEGDKVWIVQSRPYVGDIR